MKLTVDSKSFVEAANWVTKNYDAKDSNAYVALSVDNDGSAYLFHSNPTSYLKSAFTVLDTEFTKSEANKGTLKLALEGRFLQRLGSALSGVTSPLEMTRDFSSDKATLDVKTPNGKFTIPLVDTKVASEPEIITLGEVDDREYFDALQRLSKLCDPANAGFLPVLGSVDISLNSDDKKITIMATDRYALGEITIPFDPTPEAAEFIEERMVNSGKEDDQERKAHILLPVEDAQLISPSKGLTSSTILAHETKGGKYGYVFGDNRVALFSLKDADPLPYQKLKDKAAANIPNSFCVETTELKKAIQNISNLSWEENDIYLDITEDGLVVGDASRSNKMNVEIEDVEIEQEYSIKFVRSIINEAFSPISTTKMNIKWANEKSPFVLEPVLDDGSVMDNVFVFVVPSM